MLLYASNRRLEGWGSLAVGGPVELVIWRSVSSLETAPMWVSPTHRCVVSSPRDATMVEVMDPVGVCTVKSQGYSCGGGNGSCGCVVSSPRFAAMVVVLDPVGVCSVKSQGCRYGSGVGSCGCVYSQVPGMPLWWW